jgi:hypothetical protein
MVGKRALFGGGHIRKYGCEKGTVRRRAWPRGSHGWKEGMDRRRACWL